MAEMPAILLGFLLFLEVGSVIVIEKGALAIDATINIERASPYIKLFHLYVACEILRTEGGDYSSGQLKRSVCVVSYFK